MPTIKDIWVYANNIIRSSRHMVNERLKPMGLSSAEGNILLHLITQHTFRQEDLVAQLDISKPAVSRALDSLESKAYIRRTKDSKDRRASIIHLTERARTITPQLEQIYEDVFATAAQNFSPEEIDACILMFRRVSDNFNAHKGLRRKHHE